MKAGASPPALATRRQGPVRARRRGWGAPSKGVPPASVGASSLRSAQAATWARATAPACPFIVCLSAFFSGGCMKAGASPPAMAARRQGPVRARRRGWGAPSKGASPASGGPDTLRSHLNEILCPKMGFQ